MEFPHETLGVLNPPKVSVVEAEGLEAEIALVREFHAGRLGALGLAMRLLGPNANSDALAMVLFYGESKWISPE